VSLGRLLDRQLRPPAGCDCGWKDAPVVALQIRGVSESTRRTLSVEARTRGESLQEYLLELLDSEARDIDNRRLLAEWAAGPPADELQPISFVELIRSEREPQGSSPSGKLG
jgi:antitoxin FitA